MAYSGDIKTLALTKILDEKLKVSMVSRVLKINRRTIEYWLKIGANKLPKKIRPKDISAEKTQKIVEFVSQNPGLYLKEMEEKLGFSDTNIAYHLKKAGYRPKKSQIIPRKRRN